MEGVWLSGNLSELPLPFLLFKIWKSQRSGTLAIKGNKGSRVDFKDGNICVAAPSIKRLNLPELASAGDISAILEGGSLPPDTLWDRMRERSIEALTPLFDVPQAAYNFTSEHCWEEHEILFYLTTLDLILEGVRRMQNYSLIDAHLPAADKTLKPQSPKHLNQVRLNSPEIYLYHVLKNQRSLEDVYAASELGKKETQKILYAFFSLGIASPPHTKMINTQALELSQADIYNLLDAFNQKCSFIYKYISKAIGPAALNVLEKCIEDIRSHLSQPFQNIRFDASGRVEISSIQITGSSLQGQSIQHLILQDLNEILAAEILAVKRILGNDHEAALIRGLEKVSEWN
jgi:hypothetical protein